MLGKYFSYVISFNPPHTSEVEAVMKPIVWMQVWMQVRLRQVKWRVPGCAAAQWRGRAWNLCILTPEAVLPSGGSMQVDDGGIPQGASTKDQYVLEMLLEDLGRLTKHLLQYFIVSSAFLPILF